MTADNQLNLRFTVEEAVWFQKGQEVDDLVSISLYPDITIEEHDQYITIRGALQLTGEYRIDETSLDEEDATGLTYGRLMNEVETREDGISELKHRFPVDITIPKNRIQNLDDVFVSIDTFDYELPDKRCLQVVADLSISGISGNLEQELTNQVRASRREEINLNHDDLEKEDINLVTSFKYEDNNDDNFLDFIGYESHHDFSDDNLSDVNNDVDIDLYTPIEVEARKEAYQEGTTGLEDKKEDIKDVAPQIGMKSRDEDEDTWNYKQVVGAKQQPNTYQNKSKKNKPSGHEQIGEYKEKRDENALYLTNIFAKDVNQDFTRLKMCIVQNGDSLDTISERYDVTIQHLLRVNQLDQDRNIQGGQILYIPVQEKSKSY